MKPTRSPIAGALLAAAALTLAACGGGGGDEGAAPDDDGAIAGADTTAELTYGVWDLNQVPAMEALVEDFNEDYPNISVSIAHTPPQQYWTKLQTQASSGTLPDVFWMNGPNVTLYAANGMIAPIDPLLDEGVLNTANYPDAMNELYTVEGTQYAVPKDFDTVAMWFNRDVFARAGVAYWGGFEPERGRPDTARLMATATWLKDRGVSVKGHPLVWHTVTAPWLDDLTVEEVEQAQRERIRRDVADFAGVIDTWDAINEVVIMPHFDKYQNGITRLCRELGRVETVRLAFDEARAANPSATLLLNDFDLDYGYDALLEGLLAADIRIDKLGLQTHMHQGYRGEEETLDIIDRFARYGIPIHFTETTLVSGDLMPAHIVDLNDWQVDSWPSTPEGEERQASDLVRHVRTLFSHPAVEAFTYWNIWDLDAWLGAPAGLIRADGTPKPAMEALKALVKDEWWTAPMTLRTDGEGRVSVEGWRGGYAVSVAGREAAFTLGEDAALTIG